MAGRVAYHGGLVTDGLILHLDAARKPSYPGSGDTWYDLTSNQYTGSLINGTQYDKDSGNGSFVFNGVDDYITFGTSDMDYSTELTVSTWVKLDSDVGNNYIVLKYDGDSGFILGTIGDVIRVDGRAFSSYRANICSQTLQVGKWYDYTFTYSSSTWSVYLDGQLDVQNTFAGDTSIYSANSPLLVSGFPSYSSTAIDGEVNEIRMYNRALRASEVLQNYNALKGRFGL